MSRRRMYLGMLAISVGFVVVNVCMYGLLLKA